MEDNDRTIDESMKMASAAKDKGMENQVVLNTHQAARLKDSNENTTGASPEDAGHVPHPHQDARIPKSCSKTPRIR